MLSTRVIAEESYEYKLTSSNASNQKGRFNRPIKKLQGLSASEVLVEFRSKTRHPRSLKGFADPALFLSEKRVYRSEWVESASEASCRARPWISRMCSRDHTHTFPGSVEDSRETLMGTHIQLG